MTLDPDDPFDRGFLQWLRDFAYADRIRAEDGRVSTLLARLRKLGHAVVIDPVNLLILIDPDTPQTLNVTLSVARSTEPATLLQWIALRLRSLHAAPPA